MPLTLSDNFGSPLISHRFADENCEDAFEVLCRRNLQEDNSAPTSVPIQLDNGQGAGNRCIDGNREKKFSIAMFGAIALYRQLGYSSLSSSYEMKD